MQDIINRAEGRCSSRMTEHNWYAPGMSKPIVCFLEYEPPEEPRYLEPGYPAQYNLCAAWAGGINIMPLLSNAQIDAIEQECLENYR